MMSFLLSLLYILLGISPVMAAAFAAWIFYLDEAHLSSDWKYNTLRDSVIALCLLPYLIGRVFLYPWTEDVMSLSGLFTVVTLGIGEIIIIFVEVFYYGKLCKRVILSDEDLRRATLLAMTGSLMFGVGVVSILVNFVPDEGNTLLDMAMRLIVFVAVSAYFALLPYAIASDLKHKIYYPWVQFLEILAICAPNSFPTPDDDSPKPVLTVKRWVGAVSLLLFLIPAGYLLFIFFPEIAATLSSGNRSRTIGIILVGVAASIFVLILVFHTVSNMILRDTPPERTWKDYALEFVVGALMFFIGGIGMMFIVADELINRLLNAPPFTDEWYALLNEVWPEFICFGVIIPALLIGMTALQFASSLFGDWMQKAKARKEQKQQQEQDKDSEG